MASSSQTNESSNMEFEGFAESTIVVLRRVHKMDPKNASKIVANLMLQEHSEQELTNLADVSDEMFHSFIEKTKEDLNLSPKTSREDKQPIVSKLSTSFTPFVPASSRYPRAQPVNNVQIDNYAPMIQPVINNFEYAPVPYIAPPGNGVGFHHPPQYLPLETQAEHGFHNVPERAWNMVPSMCPVLPDMRYYQQHNGGYYPTQEAGESQIPVHVWIQRLEVELVNILKAKGPVPVPIACLPALYSANFGQKLLHFMQAKVGCSLHQVLAQMSRRIRLIERQGGELCVILSEDIAWYVKSVEEQREREQAADTSCQLFLTFSTKSTFTSQDVYDYFTSIGPVKGVKIPSQLRRMYGFVTFAYAATAAVVLTMGNPHFINGMQVLVKPYRGKQILDRKSDDKIRFSVWSLTDDDATRLTRVRLGLTPKQQRTSEEPEQSVGIGTENPASSSHIPSMYSYAGPSAPGGVSIGSADKGKSIVTDAYDEERYYAQGQSMMSGPDEMARYNGKGKSIVTEEEASCHARITRIITDSDDETSYDDLNLPDSPFAFEASQYDFSMIGSEWEINGSEF